MGLALVRLQRTIPACRRGPQRLRADLLRGAAEGHPARLQERRRALNSATCDRLSGMTDPNEIRALKASFRGAIDTAAALAAVESKIEALDERADISSDDLDELARITAAHAIASAALRGLINTMLARRGTATTT